MRTNQDVFHVFLLAIVIITVSILTTVAHAEQALPGDAILGYQVVDISATPEEYWQWHVKLEVNYTYNPSHQKVIVGAYVLPFGGTLETGHSYWGFQSDQPRAVEESHSGSIIRGIQRVEVAVRLVNTQEQLTNELKLFLYTPNGREFLSRTFPFQRSWNLSANSPAPSPGPTPAPLPTPTRRVIGTLQTTGPDVRLNNEVLPDGKTATVYEGDRVSTGSMSNAVILFKNGGYLHLDVDTDPFLTTLKSQSFFLTKLLMRL